MILSHPSNRVSIYWKENKTKFLKYFIHLTQLCFAFLNPCYFQHGWNTSFNEISFVVKPFFSFLTCLLSCIIEFLFCFFFWWHWHVFSWSLLLRSRWNLYSFILTESHLRYYAKFISSGKILETIDSIINAIGYNNNTFFYEISQHVWFEALVLCSCYFLKLSTILLTLFVKCAFLCYH